MNNLIASAVYKNDVTLQNGLPVLHLEIPSTSKNQQPIPIFLMQGWNMPSSVAGAFEKGTNLLVNARIYPHPDGSMYDFKYQSNIKPAASASLSSTTTPLLSKTRRYG